MQFYSDDYRGFVSLYWWDGRQWQPLIKPATTRRLAVVLTGWPRLGLFVVREVVIK